MDFTLLRYQALLKALLKASYSFITYEMYCASDNICSNDRFVIMRHDVDIRPSYALKMAQLEHLYGIKSSYYFRIVPESNDAAIIQAIADLGHEIGYHYEDLCICKGDHHEAIAHFEKSLAYFRDFYPVKTICMHGSPRSKYDPKDLWTSYNYRAYGIIGEPYRDIDFDTVYYLTDTGRCWDGEKYSLRDKVDCDKKLQIHSTTDLIKKVLKGTLPSQLMITTNTKS